MAQMVDEWIALNETNKEYDQRNLQKIYEEKYKDKIYMEELPKEYIIIERSRHHGSVPQNEKIIVHFQASRRLKRVINAR